MYMPASEDIPPITLRGNLDLTYSETGVGNLSFTGITQNLEAEVMDFTMPALEVPNGTTLAGYTVNTEVLTFEGLDGGLVYFPNTWLSTY